MYADSCKLFQQEICSMIHVRDKKLLISFGKHLVKIRKNNGLSQEKLANAANVSLSQISRLERGIINPTLSTLSALAKAMNMPLATLLDF